ncbi:MAG: RidA family protein [Devosiaceae bacterium]|nr:RidA family protein [Devosiaceae bacterium]
MSSKQINAQNAPPAIGGYSQAIEVSGTVRRLYVSGQVPMTKEGDLPNSFKDQAALVWQNIISQLQAADMSIENLVKVTIFLSDRKYNLENREARQLALGNCAPALTVIITGIFDEAWLLEIEAIAES